MFINKNKLKKPVNNDNKTVFLVGMLIGAVVFVIIYGFKILDFTYVDWLYKNTYVDVFQHQIGFEFFRNADWKWPLGEYDSYFYPIGTSIIYTDSIPFLAVIFKAINVILPHNFQYFGFFGLICFMLQGGLSCIIIKKYIPSKIVVYCSSLLFITAPIFVFRLYYHSALASHFLILLALLVWVYKDNLKSLKFRFAFWFALMGLAVMIQAYFISMLGVIMVGFLMDDFFEFKNIKRVIIVFAGALASTFLFTYIMGGFAIKSGMDTNGFGFYSMNLNSFYNPMSFSRFFKELPTATGGQYEGSMYLGLGVIILLMVAVIIRISRIRFKKFDVDITLVRQCIPVLSVLIVLLLWAITKYVTFNDQQLLSFDNYAQFRSVCVIAFIIIAILSWLLFSKYIREFVKSTKNKVIVAVGFIFLVILGKLLDSIYYALMPYFDKLFAVFRTSGRIAWPVVYFLMLLSVAYIYKNIKNKRIAAFIIMIGVAIQIVDLSPYLASRGEITKEDFTYESNLKSDVWDYISENYKHIEMMADNLVCVPDYGGIAKMATDNQITMGLGYFSRVNKDLAQDKMDENIKKLVSSEIDKNTVYIVSSNDPITLGLQTFNNPDLIYLYADGYNIIVDKDTIDEDICKQYEVERLVSSQSLFEAMRYNGTKIDNSICLDKNQMVFGPYITIYQGTYRITVKGNGIKSLYHDVYTQVGMKNIDNHVISVTDNEIVFEFTIKESVPLIEFRLRNDGDTKVTVDSIVCEQQ